MKDSNLKSGCVVLIASFDDIPEHQFLVEDVFDDCITGVSLTGPLSGVYGEPELELLVKVLWQQ